PRDVFAHNNLGSVFAHLGQPGRAADELVESARLQPSSYFLGYAIVRNRWASRFSEAKLGLEKADALKFDSLNIRRERLIVAFATGDRDTVEKILKEEEPGRYRDDFLLEHSLMEIYQGRFRSAQHLQTLSSTSNASDPYWWALISLLANAEVGMDLQAGRDAIRIDQNKLTRDDKIVLALGLARSGRTEEAGKLADQASAERPQDTLVQNYLV